MRRKLFTAAAAASLLLFVASAVMWVRSYRVGDIYQSHFSRFGNGLAGRDELWLISDVGCIIYKTHRWWTDDPRSVGAMRQDNGLLERYYVNDPPGLLRAANLAGPTVLGFFFHRSTTDSHMRALPGRNMKQVASFVVVPYWAICLLAGTMPLLWLFRYRPWRRKTRDKFCHACGYDLRATPGRCPECGADAKGADAKGSSIKSTIPIEYAAIVGPVERGAQSGRYFTAAAGRARTLLAGE